MVAFYHNFDVSGYYNVTIIQSDTSTETLIDTHPHWVTVQTYKFLQNNEHLYIPPYVSLLVIVYRLSIFKPVLIYKCHAI